VVAGGALLGFGARWLDADPDRGRVTSSSMMLKFRECGLPVSGRDMESTEPRRGASKVVRDENEELPAFGVGTEGESFALRDLTPDESSSAIGVIIST
jgi:hypothetical protein